MSSGCPPAAQWMPEPLTVSRQMVGFVVPVMLVPQWEIVLPAGVPVPFELIVTRPSGAVSLPKVEVDPNPDPLRWNRIPLSSPAAEPGLTSRLNRSMVTVPAPVMMVAAASAEPKLKVSACAAGDAKNKAEAARTAAVPIDFIAGSFIIIESHLKFCLYSC